MTKRRQTPQEQAFDQTRRDVLSRVSSEYVADAPFVFADRIMTTGALVRMELFKKVMNIPGAIIECGVYKGNALMLYFHMSMIL